ncbi:unnamed protein product [Rhizophagus irregularis]|nr:unnamed protein product [Rhizophagus irregularis]
MIMDFKLEKGKKIIQNIPKINQGFIYVLNGIDDNGDHISVEAKDGDLRFVLFTGKPLKEPIVNYGPFVMTRKKKYFKTMFDYDKNTNGFERAKNWRSSIANGVTELL